MLGDDYIFKFQALQDGGGEETENVSGVVRPDLMKKQRCFSLL